MSLKDRLRAQIEACGPLDVGQYMHACLHDPRDGYYATRPALGAAGDFITAPLVSQMFGELLGLWAVQTWRGLGGPRRFLLVEAGPGDGALIADALRAARLDPGFLAAAELWLVETSPPLVVAQRARLETAGVAARWAASLDDLPGNAPMLLIGNEFLDCLPARQFVRVGAGWAERVVGLDPRGELAFGLTPCPAPTDIDVADGAVVEVSPAQSGFAAALAERLADQGGAALLIDYGRDQPGPGDTLQALQAHRKVDPLAAPGRADLTVHADFPSLLAAAKAHGAATALTTQGEFLRRLGIETRALGLSRARPDQAATIARQLARLTDPDQMGALFKAACLYAPGGCVPPGFEEPI